MKIAVLFDGAGLARLGLEQAGHNCTGFELDPWKHHLSKFVGSGKSVLADVTKADFSGYEAAWASPPCQKRSQANTNEETSQKDVQDVIYQGYDDLLEFSLSLPHTVLWVENVIEKCGYNSWGDYYNAAQFLEIPIQLRNRIVGGRYLKPYVYREYKRTYVIDGKRICPAIMAAQGQGGYSPNFKRAEGFYGRKMTLEECAYHMGFDIPVEWHEIPDGFIGSVNEQQSERKGKIIRYSRSDWNVILFEALGNGVPVYMSRAFGQRYQASLMAIGF